MLGDTPRAPGTMYPAPLRIPVLRLPRCACNDNWSFTGFPPARELHINFSINTHLLFTSPPAPLSSRRGGINIAEGIPPDPQQRESPLHTLYHIGRHCGPPQGSQPQSYMETPFAISASGDLLFNNLRVFSNILKKK